AHHAFHGERWEKAIDYFNQAGAKAVQRSSNRAAATCFRQALAALAHLPETRERHARAIDLHFAVRAALNPLGDFQGCFEQLQEAERLASIIDDRRQLALITAFLGVHFFQTAQLTEALAYHDKAYAMAEASGDPELTRRAAFYLGQTCGLVG